MCPLPRHVYDRDAEPVARALLGTLLAHRVGDELRVGRIVETEACPGPHDLASHSARGRTGRTEVMFGPPGHADVSLVYGIHRCPNAVTGPEGHAAAVLIRALEPIRDVVGKTQGPGLLCRAMGIALDQDGHDLLGDGLVIAEPGRGGPFEVFARPRVGVGYAGERADRPLRSSTRDNAFVSRR